MDAEASWFRVFEMPRRRSPLAVRTAPFLLALTVLFPQAACNSAAAKPPEGSADSRHEGGTVGSTPALTALGVDSGAGLADVVERVLPSVVSVASSRTAKQSSPFHYFFGQPPGEQKQEGLGSGVILSKDGFIVTNNHVVEGADTLKVRTYDDREFEAKVVGTDPKSDLAVLRLQGDVSDLRPALIGDSGGLRLGEVVLAIGNPFGVGQTVTMGIVSAKGRADMGIVDYEDFIQTDAAINPGNSGGALINVRGEVVGINTAILSRSGGNMGIGFAIPTNMAVPIIDALRTEGHVTRGYLGVTIQELTADLRLAMKLGDADGVLISEAQSEGPGAKAGLKSGDVVTAVDGKAVDSTGRFRNLIAASGANRAVKLTVLRGGKQLTLPVTLGKLPDADEGPKVPGSSQGNLPEVDGLSLKDLDGELRQRLAVGDEVQGAVIVQVAPGSRAAQAQLRPGDVILSINQQAVTSAVQAKKLYGTVKGAKLLLVLRQGARLYVGIK